MEHGISGSNLIRDKIDQELVLFDRNPSMDLICDNVYLGDYASALSYDKLKKEAITHILVCAKDMVSMFPNDFVYKTLPLYDSPYTKIEKYFEESIAFIKEATSRPNGKILVHCGAGVSRSVSIVIAYLIKEKSVPYSEALVLVKSNRKEAKPNSGFEAQLRNYSYQLYKKF